MDTKVWWTCVCECSVLQVEQSKVLMKEGGVQLLLTMVDTPGFGDAVDNSNWWVPSERLLSRYTLKI